MAAPMRWEASINLTLGSSGFTHKGKHYRTGNFCDFPATEVISYKEPLLVAQRGLMWPDPPPHLLRPLVIDTESETIVVEKFDCYFSEKIVKLKNSGIHPLMKLELPFVDGAIDPASKKTVYYIPEEYREFLRSMARFLVALHQKGYCTNGFDLDDLVIKGDKLYFFLLSFSRLPLEKKTKDAAVKEDYDRLYKTVTRIYEGYDGKTLPLEFNVWCSNMLAPTSDVTNVLVDHVAILSHDERLRFVREIHEKRFEVYDEHHYALLKMNNSKRTIPGHKKGGIWYERINWNDGPMKLCFRFENIYDDEEGGHKITDNGSGENYANLLRFCRNLAVYARDYSSQLKPSHLTDAMIDVSLFDLFGHELSLFQEVAQKTKKDDKPLLSFFRYSNESRHI